MPEQRPSPSIGALQLKKKISFAWALSAVIAAIFVAVSVVLAIGLPMAGENPLARQSVVWVANVVMLLP